MTNEGLSTPDQSGITVSTLHKDSWLDVAPNKAMYKPGEEASVTVTFGDTLGAQGGHVTLNVVHLDEQVDTYERAVQTSTSVVFSFTPPSESGRGYGLDATLYGADGSTLATGSGALDVLDRWSQAPRYGFLSDFAPGQESGVPARADSLCRYHLNVVQYYDWMWRHYRLLPPTDEFTEALGRKMSLHTVRAALKEVSARGGASMAYGAVYGAEPEYANVHKDLVLYDEEGKPVSLAELFYIMDISPDSPWVDLMVSEFAETIRTLPFDGIHLDQYGFPKTAYTDKGKLVDLAVCFPPLIDRARAAVVAENADAGVIFNAVENWPIETVAPTTEDAVYIEVWPPYVSYNDLRELIANGKRLGVDKQVILAAYLTPFLDSPEATAPQAEAAALLATAVITSSGGFHLLLGENNGALCDPYYPKYGTLRSEFVPTMQAYYDFLVRYEELFTTPDVVAWEDAEVTLDGQQVSQKAETGTVWAITRSKPGYRIVNLINLTNQTETDWNALRTPVTQIAGGVLSVSDVRAVKKVLLLAPEGRTAQVVQWTQKDGSVEVQLPGLHVWASVVLVLDGE